MKNQYAGDVNDYLKYAFLRRIQEAVDDLLVICWMATADDDGPDGRKRSYLEQPEKYREVDPPLFDALHRLNESREPSITAIENASILRGARFHSPVLGDSAEERADYFGALWHDTPARSVLFFDPDNGLEIKSTPFGRKGSSKFLYMDELAVAGDNSRSVIVYQHFGRRERTSYIQSQFERIAEVLPEHNLSAVGGSHIAFLLAATNRLADPFAGAIAALCTKWPSLRTFSPG